MGSENYSGKQNPVPLRECGFESHPGHNGDDMKITVACIQEKTKKIVEQLEDFGMEVESSDEEHGNIVVHASAEGFDKISELPGVLSARKEDLNALFGNWGG